MGHTFTIRSSGSSGSVLNLVTLDYLSPGFHMIFPIATVVSKNFETIRTTGTF